MNRSFAYSLAIASGVFVLLLGAVLAYNQVQGKVATLVHSKQVIRLHEELRSRPKDDALKGRIRQLDLQLRQQTFYRLYLSQNSSRALLVGIAVFLASAHWLRSTRRKAPNPQEWEKPSPGDESRLVTVSQVAVASMAALLGATAVIASTRQVSLPSAPKEIAVNASLPTVPPFPSAEEVKQQWPAFRGPNGDGRAATAETPTSWDAAAGTNIRWKTAIPLPGFSSPVVWDKAVFVTGADSTQSCVFRFDFETGELLWSSTVKLPGGARPPKPEVMDDTGLAAPTPATDGRRVYALFPTGEVAAFDLDGKQVWARNIAPLDNTYGYAASLAIHQDRLLIQVDRGDAADGQSKMLALDTQTGQPRWETKREVGASWASPVVVEVEGQLQLLTFGNPWVVSYNPVDGKELWKLKCLESDVAPSPILAGNMIVAIAPNTAIMGFRPGASEVSWKIEEGVPEATSPVSDGQRVYFLTGEGELCCRDGQTGKELWKHELEESFYASPTLAGKHLILISKTGAAWVLATGDEFEELGTGNLGEECCASPVPVGKRLLIRGKNHLFCIEAK